MCLSANSRRGFNLTEVMVAVFFVSMALLSVVSVNAYTLRATEGNQNRQIANGLASGQLAMAESVLKINFHAPPSDINTPRLTSNQFPTFDYVVEDLGYEDPGQNLRGIRVRVFWEEDGVPRTYALATTFYNY